MISYRLHMAWVHALEHGTASVTPAILTSVLPEVCSAAQKCREFLASQLQIDS